MQNLIETFRRSVPGIVLQDFFRHRLPRAVHSNAYYVRKMFREAHGRELDLENPVTLNEKIAWLMVRGYRPFHTQIADKFAVRRWLSDRFGEDGLVPLLFQTRDWRDVRPENLPDVPCIVKCNSGSGWWQIIRDKSSVDFDELRRKAKVWLHTNYYYCSCQPQYRDIVPRILVEKLLLGKNGKIPNDYKLNFINGELAFTYCSIDREGANYRAVYDPSWHPIDVEWASRRKLGKTPKGPDIPPPSTFSRMLEIGRKVASDFPYVRVDFFDVDGKLYYGEITLHHGGGAYVISPEEWDEKWGRSIRLEAAGSVGPEPGRTGRDFS